MTKRKSDAKTGNHANSKRMRATESEAEQNGDRTEQTGGFFAKLNLDVRMIIYDSLYCSHPPFNQGRELEYCEGLVLSCKQAHKVKIATTLSLN